MTTLIAYAGASALVLVAMTALVRASGIVSRVRHKFSRNPMLAVSEHRPYVPTAENTSRIQDEADRDAGVPARRSDAIRDEGDLRLLVLDSHFGVRGSA